MKFIRPLLLASALAFVSFASVAEDAHHPDAAASAGKASKAAPAKAAPDMLGSKESMKKMDQKMMAMREMHDKMMNAKTPEERSALMADHMKAMQGGMGMMSGMAGAGKDGMPSNTETHHQMMEKRMEMMETMMQMMMDRLPPPAAK